MTNEQRRSIARLSQRVRTKKSTTSASPLLIAARERALRPLLSFGSVLRTGCTRCGNPSEVLHIRAPQRLETGDSGFGPPPGPRSLPGVRFAAVPCGHFELPLG